MLLSSQVLYYPFKCTPGTVMLYHQLSLLVVYIPFHANRGCQSVPIQGVGALHGDINLYQSIFCCGQVLLLSLCSWLKKVDCFHFTSEIFCKQFCVVCSLSSNLPPLRNLNRRKPQSNIVSTYRPHLTVLNLHLETSQGMTLLRY